MAALTLTRNSLYKAEMEYHRKFGHNLGRIQHIALMVRLEICYTYCCLATKTMSTTLPSFQGIKSCIQYMASRSYKPIFILLIIIMDQISSYLNGLGIKLKTTQPRIVYNSIKMRIKI